MNTPNNILENIPALDKYCGFWYGKDSKKEIVVCINKGYFTLYSRIILYRHDDNRALYSEFNIRYDNGSLYLLGTNLFDKERSGIDFKLTLNDGKLSLYDLTADKSDLMVIMEKMGN